jgi:hypothetical protein
MSDTSFLSSLSFFNNESEYHGINIREPESTAESELRALNHKIPRKALKHDAQSTTLSPGTDDDGKSFSICLWLGNLMELAESLLPHHDTLYRTPTASLPPPKNSHKFIRRRQLRKLLLKGFVRFFITVTLTATLLWTIFGYAKKPVMVDRQKRIFNTLVTALSMSLGIAIASSFKEVAINIRWWVLSRRKRPLSEVSAIVPSKPAWKLTHLQVDAILEAGSLTSLTVLAMKSTRDLKLKIAIICLSWVLINIVRIVTQDLLHSCSH